MGLDMYITRKEASRMVGEPSRTELAYWRKFNALHNWFVVNVQDGVDECQESPLTKTILENLLELLKKVRDTKDASLLLPQSGFFFGSTAVDDYYWQDVQIAINQIGSILATANWDEDKIFYQASW